MIYKKSEKYKEICNDIIERLNFNYIDKKRLAIVVSEGSKSKRTIARIHSLPKAIQIGKGEKPFYVIELISERFFKLSKEEKIKVLIHELMHIPKNFSGGFRNHKFFVRKEQIEENYKKLKELNRNLT
ncbi:MAG: putative metallopeptidase [Candidatus Diapherotrites archaeon]|nr:putative metallopeptidase [Candidatus Diapherotrites archaeon]